MFSAVLVLIAVSLGVKSLTAFGYGAWDIVVILVPMAVLVALFFTGVTYLGFWSVRRLNETAETSKTEGAPSDAQSGEAPGD